MSDEHILELTAAVARIEAKLDAVDKGLNGNGMPGLKQKVEDLEASKNRVWGVGAALTFFAGLAEWLLHKK